MTLIESIKDLQVDFDIKANALEEMSSLVKDENERNRLKTKAGCYRACANDVRRALRDSED